MVTWGTFEERAEPVATFGRERIDGRVSFLATIRPDGGPRVHPVTPWVADGRLYVRTYRTSPKASDLERDPRYALHSMMDNDDGIGGEFSLRGRAERVDDAEEVATAYAAIGEPGTRPLVLFTLGVDGAMSTEYADDETVRRRWSAEDP
ncbi:MAG TPA: pyridoxamine 5'-phosphate oxidase family protein [Actinomycetota bacterium]|jgi:hypothetical protein